MMLPKGTIKSVKSMKRKMRILLSEVYKWKARFSCHGR
jgi:hypothetical protein